MEHGTAKMSFFNKENNNNINFKIMRKQQNLGLTPFTLIFLSSAILSRDIVLGANGNDGVTNEEYSQMGSQASHHHLPFDYQRNGNSALQTGIPFPLQRVKRDKDGGQAAESQSEEEENCIRLPPKPPLPSSHAPINLMDLLNGGHQYMADDDSIKDAILLLGNTGSGKSTLGQILAGNLNRVHAVLTQSGELVIIDDDNRIGAPSSVSKTLVPELVMKQGGEDEETGNWKNGNRTAFFDCPGFDDTRGTEHDIAANFFMNQIVRKVNRVKLIFLVIQSSVKAGHDRLDFDLMVGHAAKFLKNNIPNYSKSIGLVVTKVNSYNHRGKFISEVAIMNGIVEFLQNYNQTLHSQLESNSSQVAKGEQERKIQFVEALLAKDANGEYSKISFSRSPLKCGALSGSKTVSETKKRIAHLYSHVLEYSPVNWKDFGYTLKDRTKLALRNYVTSLNEQVTKGISLLMKDFSDWYQTDTAHIENELQRSADAMKAVVSSLNNLEGQSNPEDVMEIIKPSLETLGYTVPIKVLRFMRQQQAIFLFFDEANGTPVSRTVTDWMDPIDNVKTELEELREWYDFCRDLQARVGSYDFQLGKPKMPGSEMDWLNFLESECRMPVGSRIHALNSKLGRIHLDCLDKIMRFALKPAEVKCKNEGATITGNYVMLSKFISKSWPLVTQCDTTLEHKDIEIYAAHTIFIDDDVEAEGMELNLVIIASNLVVVGRERHINLNGLPGEPHSHKADDGTDGYAGKYGKAGKAGGPGGSFFGLVLHTKDASKLTISSNGGIGGNGQEGGNGGEGETPRNANYYDAPRYSRLNVIVYERYKDQHNGFSGEQGGDGGNGGASGFGGISGKIQFLHGYGKVHEIKINNRDGVFGKPGKGGKGGIGGKHGTGIHCVKKVYFFGVFGENLKCEETNYLYGRAPNGRDGVTGTSFLDFVDRRSPYYSIKEWKSILNFKLSAKSVLDHNETQTFVRFMDSDYTARSYFNVEGFTEELQMISEHNLGSLLSSYISKVESYAQPSLQWRVIGVDEKKVVAYLLATAYSKLIASERDRGMGMVVDLGQFFNVVKAQMTKLKETSALALIEQESDSFGNDIKRKIKEVRRFQEEVATPAVQQAKMELQVKLRNLEKQFEKLLRNAESDLNSSMRSLSGVIQAQEEEALTFKQILDIIETIVKVTAFTGEVLSLAEGEFPMIWVSANEVIKDLKTLMEVGPEEGGGSITSLLNSCVKLWRSGSNLFRMLKTANDIDSGEEVLDGQNDIEDNHSHPGHGNFTNATAYFGVEMVTNLLNIFNGETEEIARLEKLLKETQEKFKEVHKRKTRIEQSFTPVVETLLGSLSWMMEDLRNKSRSSTVEASEPDIRKWQITTVLRGVKGQLEMLGKGVETKEFLNAIDLVQDSLTMNIDLFDDIVKYEETRKLAEYVAVINSAKLKTIHVRNPILSSSIAKMDKAIVTNSFMKDYQRALHAFKQWVFPFAKLHMTKDLQLNRNVPDDMDGDTYIKQVEMLQLAYDNYKGSTLDAHDTHLIHTNFSSSHRSSSPFFVWRNDKWSPDIQDLLAGRPVYLKADVKLTHKDWDAVKFKLIEINLKIPEGKQSDRENQQSLNSELEHFGVVMTHSGLSYYRFQGKFYGMTGANQTIRYNFERDSGSGNRLGTNRVYEKFKSGDYLLSPYTLWTIQLVITSPRYGHISFRSLERFAPYVDLELVGTGIYVDGRRMGEDLEVGKYYVKDDSIRNDLNL